MGQSSLILGKFRIGDVISFEVYAGEILSQDYDNVKVQAIIPAHLCDTFGYDVFATHAQIYRLIPEGRMEDNPRSYHYLLVESENGNTRVVGLPWINESTIRVFHQNTATYTVHDVDQEDIHRIAEVIAQYGYHCTLKINEK